MRYEACVIQSWGLMWLLGTEVHESHPQWGCCLPKHARVSDRFSWCAWPRPWALKSSPPAPPAGLRYALQPMSHSLALLEVLCYLCNWTLMMSSAKRVERTGKLCGILGWAICFFPEHQCLQIDSYLKHRLWDISGLPDIWLCFCLAPGFITGT